MRVAAATISRTCMAAKSQVKQIAARAILEAKVHLAVHQAMREMNDGKVNDLLALVKTKNLINFLIQYKNTPLYLMSGELYAKVAHALMGLLAGLMDWPDAILETVLADEDQPIDRENLKRDVVLLQQRIQGVWGIIESIKICHKAMGKLAIRKEVNLNDLIKKRESFHSVFSGCHDLNVNLDLAIDLAFCDLDPSKIEHVLINLLLNAYQAIGQGKKGDGTILVTTQNITFNGLPGIEISIRDDGCGLPIGREQHVFEPFFTTKEVQGTGLGLTVSRDIIEMHHGNLTIANNSDGPGVTVTIQLPVKQPQSK